MPALIHYRLSILALLAALLSLPLTAATQVPPPIDYYLEWKLHSDRGDLSSFSVRFRAGHVGKVNRKVQDTQKTAFSGEVSVSGQVGQSFIVCAQGLGTESFFLDNTSDNEATTRIHRLSLTETTGKLNIEHSEPCPDYFETPYPFASQPNVRSEKPFLVFSKKRNKTQDDSDDGFFLPASPATKPQLLNSLSGSTFDSGGSEDNNDFKHPPFMPVPDKMMANLILLPTLSLPVNWRDYLPFAGLYHWLMDTEPEGVTIILRFDHFPPVTFRISQAETSELAEHLPNIRQLLHWLAPRLNGRERLVQQLLEVLEDSEEQSGFLSEEALESIQKQLAIVLEQPDTEFSLEFELSELVRNLVGLSEEGRQQLPGTLQYGQTQSGRSQAPATSSNTRENSPDSHREQRQNLNPQRPANQLYPELDMEELESRINALNLTLPYYTVRVHQTRYRVSKALVLSLLLQPASSLLFDCLDCDKDRIPYAFITVHSEEEGHSLVCEQCRHFQPEPGNFHERWRMLRAHTQSQCQVYRGENPITLVDQSLSVLRFMFRFGTEEALLDLLQEVGLPDVVEHLQQADIYGKTLFHELAQNDSQRVIRAFVSRFGSLMSQELFLLQDCRGRNLLHYLFEVQPEALILEFADSMYNLITTQSLAARDYQNQTPMELLMKRDFITATVKLSKAIKGQFKPANPDAPNSQGETPLYIAVKKGDIKTIRALIEGGANPVLPSSDGWLPLLLAACKGQLDSVKLMVEALGKDWMQYRDSDGWSALHFAVGFGRLAVVRYLLSGENLESTTSQGNTPLHLAVLGGQLPAVVFLLEQGASLQAQNKEGKTPLHVMAERFTDEQLKAFWEQCITYLKPGFLNAGHSGESAQSLAGALKSPVLILKERPDIADATRQPFLDWAKLVLAGDINASINQDGFDGTALHHAARTGQTAVAWALIKKGANLEVQDKRGKTPLHWSASCGQTETAVMLIENGAKLEAQIYDTEETPLNEAAYSGKTQTVLALIRKGANLEAQENYMSRTPLHDAAREGNTDTALALIEKGAKLEALNACYETPLHDAAVEGKTETVLALIGKGAKIEAQHGGETPLHKAAYYGRNAETVLALIGKGAKLEARTVNIFRPHIRGSTPLDIAVRRGSIEAALALYQEGASTKCLSHDQLSKLNQWLGEAGIKLAPKNINPTDYGRLRQAVSKGDTPTVLACIEAGMELDNYDDTGTTLLISAAEKGDTEIVKIVLEGGAKVDKPHRSKNFTALTVAVQCGNSKIIRSLLDWGANVNQGKTVNGFTTLMIAAQDGHLEIIRALLDQGASVEEKTNDGHTALMIASRYGHTEAVRVLLDRGANINQGTLRNRNYTALCFAAQNGHTKTAQALIERGASIDRLPLVRFTELQQLLLKAGITPPRR